MKHKLKNLFNTFSHLYNYIWPLEVLKSALSNFRALN